MSKQKDIIIGNLNFRAQDIADDLLEPPDDQDAVVYEEGDGEKPGRRPYNELVKRALLLLDDICALNDKKEMGSRFGFLYDGLETSIEMFDMPLSTEYEWNGIGHEKYRGHQVPEEVFIVLERDVKTLLKEFFERCRNLSDDESRYYDDDLCVTMMNISSLMKYLSRWGALMFIYQDRNLDWQTRMMIPDDCGNLQALTF